MSLASDRAPAAAPTNGRDRLHPRELQRWLVRNETALSESSISASFGRAPTLIDGRGATWISFESPRMLGRALLGSTGRCRLVASSRADGAVALDDEVDALSTAHVDKAMALLVSKL